MAGGERVHIMKSDDDREAVREKVGQFREVAGAIPREMRCGKPRTCPARCVLRRIFLAFALPPPLELRVCTKKTALITGLDIVDCKLLQNRETGIVRSYDARPIVESEQESNRCKRVRERRRAHERCQDREPLHLSGVRCFPFWSCLVEPGAKSARDDDLLRLLMSPRK